MAGKGSTPRPVDATTYRENWDRIFRGKCETCDGLEGWESFRDVNGLAEEIWVPCPTCQPHNGDLDALDELTQLSQDMGMYPPIDESKDRA